jgi:hypothetical protein
VTGTGRITTWRHGLKLKQGEYPMKPLIELSIEHYEALLKGAAKNSPLYSRLTNAVKTQKTIVIRCERDEAEMLLHMAKTFALRPY